MIQHYLKPNKSSCSWLEGFPGSSADKESAYNAVDPGTFPGSDPSVGKIPWRRERLPTPVFLGFPCGSAGKESTCNAGDPGSIPGSGRFTGEGISYPLQYSWVSLVAQLVKNPPAMQETWVWSLVWEDSPGVGKGYPLHYSGLENSMDCIVHGVAKTTEQLSLSFS